MWTEARNISGKTLYIGHNAYGFRYRIALRRLEGRPFGDDLAGRYCAPNGIDGRPTDRIVPVKAPPGWTEKQRQDPCCMDQPGDYGLRITVSSTGPFYIWPEEKTFPETITEKDIWRGELQSEEVIIKVIAPTNEIIAQDNTPTAAEAKQLLAAWKD